MSTKAKVIVSVILFAAAFILDGVASKLLPFDDIVKALVKPKKA